ncbi:extracellular solute-binding protein family 1 [Oceanithermus profundus DSM 14977]|uniref:Extracellular solute-binding protein family 1 n=1 Tax=Oceanithermus profundus (strain DSM 14977 / NBRC 100410 / VKM B-2274 / 506) TaxID=670487 RepID=E4U6S5_OCEP5|nr:sugar ABC transporter substrate-binding protein [Oceanithermus profundus]ADR35869.1 extracellular solute-binding protein family 1 [Oceanithermus profundus DSM 14977]
MKRWILKLGALALVLTMGLGAAKTTKVTVAGWGGESEIALYKELFKKFEAEHPNIKVELLHIPSRDYWTKLTAMFAAGKAPDLFFTNNINFPALAAKGVARPLEPFIKKDNYDTGIFYKGILDAFRFEGKLYALPRDISNMVVYYNRDLLREAGLPDPDPDWTWDDFLRYAKALTKEEGGKRTQWGVSFYTYFLFWEPWVWSNGGRWYSPDHSKFLLNSPASVEGLQFYVDLRWKHHVAPTPAEAADRSAYSLFLGGKTGMIVDGRWRVPSLKKKAKFDWDIVPFPRGKAGSIVDIDGSGWAISRQSRNPDAAWEVLKFLAGPEGSLAFTKGGLIIPAIGFDPNNPQATNAILKAFFQPPPPRHQQYFLTVNKDAVPTETFERWSEALNLISKALGPVWEGKEDVQTALDKVAPAVQKILDEVQAERAKRK